MRWDQFPHDLQLVIQRSLQALDPYRRQLILVGGLAKFFYAAHPDFIDPGIQPRATVDLDVAMQRETLVDTQIMHERLTEAGLVDFIVLDEQGVPFEQQYQLREHGRDIRQPACLEFLTPAAGSERRPRRQQGVLPTPLPHVDLFFQNPVSVEMPDVGTLLLPHPLSFIMQKQLIRERRRPEFKKATDQADIFYVIYGFQPIWSGWIAQWTHLQGMDTFRRRLETVRRSLHLLYRDADATGSREVAGIYSAAGRGNLDPALAARVMGDFLGRLPH